MRTFLLVLFIFPLSLFSHDLKTIVEHIDKLFRSESSHGEFAMKIQTPDWSRTLELEAYSKGMDNTFIIIKAPKKDRGISTLRKKNEMWNYFPKVDRVIKVPPSMMMGSWMGSDFTNDDLVREVSLLDDYVASFSDEKAPDDFVWISLKPKRRTVTFWGEIRLLVDLSTYIPSKQIYFDEHHIAVRELLLFDIQMMGGKKIPTTLEMVPLHKKNHKTVIKYLWIDFDQPLGGDIFSLKNLRKKR